MSQSNTYTVRATVTGVDTTPSGKTCVKVTVPVFKSRHATELYQLEPAQLAALTPLIGQETVIVLAADRVRPPKEGEQPRDPTRPFNWYWSLVRIGGPDDTPADAVTMPAVQDGGTPAPPATPPANGAAPAAAAPAPHPETAYPRTIDARDGCIMAQTALKCAVDSIGDLGLDTASEVTDTADAYHRWLLSACRRSGGTDAAPQDKGAADAPRDAAPWRFPVGTSPATNDRGLFVLGSQRPQPDEQVRFTVRGKPEIRRVARVIGSAPEQDPTWGPGWPVVPKPQATAGGRLPAGGSRNGGGAASGQPAPEATSPAEPARRGPAAEAPADSAANADPAPAANGTAAATRPQNPPGFVGAEIDRTFPQDDDHGS